MKRLFPFLLLFPYFLISNAFAQANIYYTRLSEQNHLITEIVRFNQNNGVIDVLYETENHGRGIRFEINHEEQRLYLLHSGLSLSRISIIDLSGESPTHLLPIVIGEYVYEFRLDPIENRIFWTNIRGTLFSKELEDINSPIRIHHQLPPFTARFGEHTFVTGRFNIDAEDRKLWAVVTSNSTDDMTFLVVADLAGQNVVTNVRYFAIGKNFTIPSIDFVEENFFFTLSLWRERVPPEIFLGSLSDAASYVNGLHEDPLLEFTPVVSHEELGGTPEHPIPFLNSIAVDVESATLHWRQGDHNPPHLNSVFKMQDVESRIIRDVLVLGDEEIHLVGNAPTFFETPEPGGAVEIMQVSLNTTMADPAPLPGRVDQHGMPIVETPTSWTEQRSDIRSIEIAFTGTVNLDELTIMLVNLGLEVSVGSATFFEINPQSVEQLDADTVVVRLGHNELPDGLYDLAVFGDRMDEDGDGNADGIATYLGDLQNKFFKLTGDFNGDGGASIFDFPTFSYWFGKSTPRAPEYVDINGDGGISIFDFPAFADGFGRRIVD